MIYAVTVDRYPERLVQADSLRAVVRAYARPYTQGDLRDVPDALEPGGTWSGTIRTDPRRSVRVSVRVVEP